MINFYKLKIKSTNKFDLVLFYFDCLISNINIINAYITLQSRQLIIAPANVAIKATGIAYKSFLTFV